MLFAARSCHHHSTRAIRTANICIGRELVAKSIAAGERPAGDGHRTPEAPLHTAHSRRWLNSGMDLIRHLRFFVTVAEEGHFGRAAAALDMTQPPLSQGLRRLEQHIGTTLVHRTQRGAVLTTAGATLLPRARLLVDDSERFLAEAERVSRTRGVVRWGATAALPDRIITTCAAVLRTEPDVTIATEVAAATDLIAAVRSGMCDLAVVEHPALLDGVEAGPVTKVPRWVVVPAGHRSARAERPRFPMLCDLSFATHPRAGNPAGFDATQDLLRERGLDVDPTTVPDDRTILAAVAAGRHFGISTAPPGSVPGVAWLTLAPDAIALRVRIVWRHGAEVDRHVAAIDRVLFRERAK